MRFITVPNAQAARKSVLWATGRMGYFYLLTSVIGFGTIVMVATESAFLDPKATLLQANNGGHQRLGQCYYWQISGVFASFSGCLRTRRSGTESN